MIRIACPMHKTRRFSPFRFDVLRCSCYTARAARKMDKNNKAKKTQQSQTNNGNTIEDRLIFRCCPLFFFFLFVYLQLLLVFCQLVRFCIACSVTFHWSGWSYITTALDPNCVGTDEPFVYYFYFHTDQNTIDVDTSLVFRFHLPGIGLFESDF